MGYWNRVLTEVLNKHDPHYPVALTNVRGYSDSQIVRFNRPPQLVECPGVYKQPAKKNTQVVGQIKKYGLGKKFPDVYFTKREAQVAYCFINGKSTIQTAKLLKLSRRTVEFYTNNMKIKLHCRLKSDLLNVIMKSDFMNTIDDNLRNSCQ
jgi:DNA-binding CsgD family transcriptional regulator